MERFPIENSTTIIHLSINIVYQDVKCDWGLKSTFTPPRDEILHENGADMH